MPLTDTAIRNAKPGATWPREGTTSGGEPVIFIPRAFNMIGKAQFADDWRGIEGHAALAKPLPPNQAALTYDEIRLIEWMLQNYRSEFKGRNPPKRNPASGTIGGLGDLGGFTVPADYHDPDYKPFDDDDWAAAVALFETEIVRKQSAIERRKTVVEWLVSRIADTRELRVVLRDPKSGQEAMGPPEHWNNHWHQLEGRWRQGSYFYEAPFAPAGVSRLEWHEVEVFVVEADLTALLEGKVLALPATIEDSGGKPRTKRTRKSDPEKDQDSVFEIKGYRTALRIKFATDRTLATQALARAVADELNKPEKFERLKQILTGKHALSNRLIKEGLLEKWTLRG